MSSMPFANAIDDEIHVPNAPPIPGLRFRGLRRPSDFPILNAISNGVVLFKASDFKERRHEPRRSATPWCWSTHRTPKSVDTKTRKKANKCFRAFVLSWLGPFVTSWRVFHVTAVSADAASPCG